MCKEQMQDIGYRQGLRVKRSSYLWTVKTGVLTAFFGAVICDASGCKQAPQIPLAEPPETEPERAEPSLVEKTLPATPYRTIRGTTQGTLYSVIYESPGCEDLQASITERLDAFERAYSRYRPSSLVSRINRSRQPVSVDSDFEAMFRLAREVHQLSNGAFDITVGPLVRAWGVERKQGTIPSPDAIDEIRSYVGMEHLTLRNGFMAKKDHRVRLDLNAIAQGYSVDLLGRFLEAKGVRNYLVEVGGELRARGVNAKKKVWRVGIELPEEGTPGRVRLIKTAISLKNRSLATSGNYRKFIERNGEKLVHTIDPRTGRSKRSDLLSATVVAESAAKADALATAFMVMGRAESRALVGATPGIDAVLLYSDKDGALAQWVSGGVRILQL